MFVKEVVHALLFSILLCTACTPWPSEVGQALELAGENRPELEKVLEHYSTDPADSLKLRAAEFLIAGMLFHSTQYGPGVDSLNVVYKEVYGVPDKERGKLFNADSVRKRRKGKVHAEYDIRRTRADFLISQVEAAFETYQNFEWCREYPFDTFCEYILPYKIGYADTINWRGHVLGSLGTKMLYLDWERGERYEAELYAPGDTLVREESEASGEKVFRLYPGGSLALEILFEIRSNHPQRLLVSCFNGNSESTEVEILMDGSLVEQVIIPPTEKWWGRPVVELFTQLDTGVHTLTLRAVNQDVFIDFLEVPHREPAKSVMHEVPYGKYRLYNDFGYVKLLDDTLKNGSRMGLTKDKESATPIRIRPSLFGTYTLLVDQEGFTSRGFDASMKSDTSTKVHLWYNYGNSNQRWALIPEGDGYKIKSMGMNKSLTWSEEDSLLVQLPGEGLGKKEVWQLEAIYDSAIAAMRYDTISQPVKVAQMVNYLTNEFKWHDLGTTLGPIDPISILKYKYGTCGEETKYQTMVLRSLGVACAVDFVLHWGDRGPGHSWSVIFDTNGNTIQNNCHHQLGAKTKADDFKKGKVYRKTNSINYESLFVKNNGGEPIPSQFQKPYFKDVTDEYCETFDFNVGVALNQELNNQFGYLMVANYEHDWVATGWGQRDDQAVTFKNVEPYVVFLPTFYDADKNYQPFNSPFYLDSLGQVNLIKADTNSLQTLSLKRKFPNRMVKAWHHRRIIGGKFQGANRPDFADSVTLGVIDSMMLDPIYHTINLDTPQKFKYLRYLGPEGGHCNMSEVLFFDMEGDTIKGVTIGTEAKEERPVEKAFDGDVLSYFEAKSPNDGWVGLKLKEPILVNKIRFAARNDGNMIEAGNEYELVYWDREWKSMGRIKAAADSLVYENVPKGALYLLHNHTKGKEERIFTWEDGKQVWW